MKIAILDENYHFADALRITLSFINDFEVLIFCDFEIDSFSFDRLMHADIVFIDISLDIVNSISVIKALRKMNADIMIFCTTISLYKSDEKLLNDCLPLIVLIKDELTVATLKNTIEENLILK